MSYLKGFRFNGQHSREYGILLESYTVGTPAKRKSEVEVPFRSGTLDFSTFFTGENTFSNREIKVKAHVVSKTTPELKVIYNKILNWLVDTNGKAELIFDDAKGYVFLAEVNTSIDYEEFYTAGTFDITFTAEPFRKSVDYQGTRITWDLFNFLEDVLNETHFIVSGTQENSFIHAGRNTTPTIRIISGSLKLKSGNYTTPLLAVGDHIDYNFTVFKGQNTITSYGNGEFELLFKKEAI